MRGASTPSRSSRRPSCCCRSACRATSPVARPRAEEVTSAADVRELVPPRPAPVHLAARPRSPRTHLLSNGRYAVMLTDRRLRLQPLARASRSRAGARTPRATPGAATSSCATSQSGARLVGRLPAERPRGRQLRGRLLRGPRRVPPARRRDRDRARGRRLARGRRRDPPRLAHQPRRAAPRDRADVLRRGRARRRRPPTPRTRRSRTCSCRPSASPSSARCSRPAGRGRATSRRLWAAHVVAVEGEPAASIQYETDRARFLGRGRAVRTPASVIDGRPLVEHRGPVLDPIFSLRRRVRARPGRDRARHLLDRSSPSRARQVARPGRQVPRPGDVRARRDLAWTQAQVQLHHLGIDAGRGAPLPAPRQPDPLLRPDAAAAARPCSRGNRPGAAGAVGARDLRRPADRAGADRRGRRHRHRAPAAAGARVLAAEGARGRPRDPERARRRPTPRICRPRSRRWCARASRRRRPREPPSHGGVFVLRGEPLDAPKTRRCSRRSRARCCSSRRGTLAEQLDPPRAAASRRCRRAPARRRRPAAGAPAEPPIRRARARVLQRPRRLRRRRARVRDRPRDRASRRRRPGSTSIANRRSASRSPSPAPATPGRATAARTS